MMMNVRSTQVLCAFCFHELKANVPLKELNLDCIISIIQNIVYQWEVGENMETVKQNFKFMWTHFIFN